MSENLEPMTVTEPQWARATFNLGEVAQRALDLPASEPSVPADSSNLDDARSDRDRADQ